MSGWYDHVVVPRFYRALWVVGTSAAGKSTYAERVAAEHQVPVLECGRWVRDMHCPGSGPDEMAATTLSILGKDERYFSRRISRELERLSRVVVVGARNPIDFVDNFDPSHDSLVLLGLESFPSQSGFERDGIRAIEAHAQFMVSCSILPDQRVVRAEPMRSHAIA